MSHKPHSPGYIDVIDQDPEDNDNNFSINQEPGSELDTNRKQIETNTMALSKGSLSMSPQAGSEFDREGREFDKNARPEWQIIHGNASSMSQNLGTLEFDTEEKEIDESTRRDWQTVHGETSSMSEGPATRGTKIKPGGSKSFHITDTGLTDEQYIDGFNPVYRKVEAPMVENAPDNLDTFISSAATRMKTFRGILKH